MNGPPRAQKDAATNQAPTNFLFDALGAIFWVLCVLALYRAETAVVTVPADGFPQGIANYQLINLQTQAVIVSVGCGVIGTLFFGFSAVTKALKRLGLRAASN